jgi:hypothetical protein
VVNQTLVLHINICCENPAQRDIAIFFTFPFAHMQHPAVRVQISQPHIKGLKTAQTIAIEQPDQDPVLEQFGSFE